MWKYSEKLMDHFMNPRNSGELDHPDGHSEVGSPQCGDAMTLDIEVDEDDHITDIRFMTFGCAGAIAAASALTEIAKGKSLEEAVTIRNSQIVDFLGGMPAEKYHCSVMGHDALSQAVEDFRKKKEQLRAEVDALLVSMPEELVQALEGNDLKVDHVHSSWIRLSGGEYPQDRVAEVLSGILSGRLDRKIEVRISK